MRITTRVSENDDESSSRSKRWIREIWNAQRDRTRVISGREYERIPYGREGRGWRPPTGPCGDCAVARGQYHVPGCDLERCPACRGQMISCGCPGP